jgi:exonuclease III|nr:hypothetical protein [Nonlabens sp. Ci31]
MEKKFERKTDDQPLTSFGDRNVEHRDLDLEKTTIKDKQKTSK